MKLVVTVVGDNIVNDPASLKVVSSQHPMCCVLCCVFFTTSHVRACIIFFQSGSGIVFGGGDMVADPRRFRKYMLVHEYTRSRGSQMTTRSSSGASSTSTRRTRGETPAGVGSGGLGSYRQEDSPPPPPLTASVFICSGYPDPI